MRAPSTVLAPLAPLALAAVLLTGCGGGDDTDGADGTDGRAPSAAPAPPLLARELVEQQVRTQLAEEVGREPEQVTCPGDLAGVVGDQMLCNLTDSGLELGVTLTVTAVEGEDVRFDIVVDPAE
jgi:hypothetical protein